MLLIKPTDRLLIPDKVVRFVPLFKGKRFTSHQLSVYSLFQTEGLMPHQ